jgi:hypothetical protein
VSLLGVEPSLLFCSGTVVFIENLLIVVAHGRRRGRWWPRVELLDGAEEFEYATERDRRTAAGLDPPGDALVGCE